MTRSRATALVLYYKARLCYAGMLICRGNCRRHWGHATRPRLPGPATGDGQALCQPGMPCARPNSPHLSLVVATLFGAASMATFLHGALACPIGVACHSESSKLSAYSTAPARPAPPRPCSHVSGLILSVLRLMRIFMSTDPAATREEAGWVR
jgi:hypothetical protein